MNVEFRRSFTRDLRKTRNRQILRRVQEVIEQVEMATSLSQLPQVKKLSGYSDYYRIRIGDYRLGIRSDGETVTFIRFLHRRDIYRSFP